ncbi:CPXCG motif-containing cysteine-rich protein [Pseudomaricurvus sp.]|uniref:CPXCG motif-containing cysteine-rich protein n=1 Tax=Pseudomaricurvus sp. TaxID=2004510 RepID=UPI003F6CBB8D
MNGLEPSPIDCPYCGETIEVLIDCSVPQQSYIEDCQVCCRPIQFDVTIDESGDPSVIVSHENE